MADTTMCLILNLYRRTYWLANMVKEGKKITGPEQLKDAAYGCARIRGDTLGIVGLGEAMIFFFKCCDPNANASKSFCPIMKTDLSRFILV